MFTDILATCQFLNITDLDSLTAYRAEALSHDFNKTELTLLLKSLRDYLYHLKVLPDQLGEFKRKIIPIESLGLKVSHELALKQANIEIVGQFLAHEKQLTWPETDLLAARIRFLVLLMVWAEQTGQLYIATHENILPIISSARVAEMANKYQIVTPLPSSPHVPAPVYPAVGFWASYEDDEFGDDLFFLHQPWSHKMETESWENWGYVTTRQFENDDLEEEDLSHETNLSILSQHLDTAMQSWHREIIDHIPLSDEQIENIEDFEYTKQIWRYFNQQMKQILGFTTRQIHGYSLEECLVKTLETLQTPAHYLNITERFSDLFSVEIDEKQIYGYLKFFASTFIALGEGVFSLILWERQRKQLNEPTLPFCGTMFAPLNGKSDAFLESILVAHQHLQKQPKVAIFLDDMLQWAGLSNSIATWQKQTVLNSYYLVGLIPYTFYLDDDYQTISTTLPELNVTTLREHCLATLNRRLVAMPEFWWVVQTYQPGNPTDFANHFVDLHPFHLNDVIHRLNLLIGLGAIQRSTYGNQCQLTNLGLSLSQLWANIPEFLLNEPIPQNNLEEDFSFGEIDLW